MLNQSNLISIKEQVLGLTSFSTAVLHLVGPDYLKFNSKVKLNPTHFLGQ